MSFIVAVLVATSLQHLVDRIASAPPYNRAQLGVSIVESAGGKELASRQSGVEFTPASSFKLVVAATALADLGPRFRAQTVLLARGHIVRGTLDGDLILVGGGDPLLARRDLLEAAQAVKGAGIVAISGTILPDSSLFDRQRYAKGWAWDDFPFDYQAPVEALAVDEGAISVSIAPGARVGDEARVTADPYGDAMAIENQAVTGPGGGRDDADCFRSPGSQRVIITGFIPQDSSPEHTGCAVDDNPVFAVSVLRRALSDAGVSVGAQPHGEAPSSSALDQSDPRPLDRLTLQQRYADGSIVWTHSSPPVAALLERMLPPSDNFIADMLMKMLPAVVLRERGSFAGGESIERRFFAAAGIEPQTLIASDGSGLSTEDRITPSGLTALLRYELHQPSGTLFVNALPRAGLDGTLKMRMRGTDAQGRVRAKSGTLNFVSTLAGYAQTRHHGAVAFAIMFNDAAGKPAPYQRAEDEIVEAIVRD